MIDPSRKMKSDDKRSCGQNGGNDERNERKYLAQYEYAEGNSY